MTTDVLAFTVVFAVLATFVVAGFALLFTELRRLETKLDNELAGFRRDLDAGFTGLRRDLAEEFRSQRAEVLAQTSAIAAAINASRTGST